MPEDGISWFWWAFSAIGVALLVNLASAYMKPRIDNLWETAVRWRRQQSMRRQQEFNDMVEYLISYPESILWVHMTFSSSQIISRLYLLSALITAALTLILAVLGDIVLGAKTFLQNMSTILAAGSLYCLVNTFRYRKRLVELIQVKEEYELRRREQDPDYEWPPF